eukprot:2674439-Pyramimonas_sp.AAC.1
MGVAICFSSPMRPKEAPRAVSWHLSKEYPVTVEERDILLELQFADLRRLDVGHVDSSSRTGEHVELVRLTAAGIAHVERIRLSDAGVVCPAAHAQRDEEPPASSPWMPSSSLLDCHHPIQG